MSADESCADPSLPLQDLTLARSVHWAADTRQPAQQGEDARWQMDGSNQSIGKPAPYPVPYRYVRQKLMVINHNCVIFGDICSCTSKCTVFPYRVKNIYEGTKCRDTEYIFLVKYRPFLSVYLKFCCCRLLQLSDRYPRPAASNRPRRRRLRRRSR